MKKIDLEKRIKRLELERRTLEGHVQTQKAKVQSANEKIDRLITEGTAKRAESLRRISLLKDIQKSTIDKL